MRLVTWLHRWSVALKARRARLESETRNRWSGDDAGLRVSRNDQIIACVPWDQIAEIVAFKRELFAIDQICIGFRMSDSDEYTCIDEENPDYERVVKLIEERFALRQDWWATVAFPAFKRNWTTIWGQPPSDPL